MSKCKGSECQTRRNASSMARQLGRENVRVVGKPGGKILYKSVPQRRTAAQKKAAQMDVAFKQIGRSALNSAIKKAVYQNLALRRARR